MRPRSNFSFTLRPQKYHRQFSQHPPPTAQQEELRIRRVGYQGGPILERRLPSRRQSLAHRRVFVTGGSSGIGYAIAKRFVEEGVEHVTINGRDEEKLSGAVSKMKEEMGSDSIPVQIFAGNITDAGFAQQAMKSGYGNQLFDILVNCAGMSQNKLMLATDEADIDMITSVNLGGTMTMSRGFFKLHFGRYLQAANLRKRRGETEEKASNGSDNDSKNANPVPSACIINVASLLATRGGVGATAYAASKAGVIAFTRAIAAECGDMWKGEQKSSWPPVRVNAIVPGYIDTPMLDEFDDEAKEQLREQIPLRRFGTPGEVADAAVFLATNEYSNNCILNLDGGLSAT